MFGTSPNVRNGWKADAGGYDRNGRKADAIARVIDGGNVRNGSNADISLADAIGVKFPPSD